MSEGRGALKLLLKNRLTLAGAAVVLALALVALAAPWLAPNPAQALGRPDMGNQFRPPGPGNWLGTDDLGRDLLSRIIYGTRISLHMGTLVILLAMAIGVPLGAIAGYAGGVADEVVMRLTDVFLGFPPLLLALAVASLLGPGLANALVAIAITWWPWYTRLVRAQVLSLRETAFVEAARSLGAGHGRIVFRHLLPNSLSPVIVQASMDVGYAILTAAALSFIGLGAQPPAPEWGLMVATGRKYFMQYWWYATFPGLAVFVTVLAFNLFGDGLRDVLDPRTRRQ